MLTKASIPPFILTCRSAATALVLDLDLKPFNDLSIYRFIDFAINLNLDLNLNLPERSDGS